VGSREKRARRARARGQQRRVRGCGGTSPATTGARATVAQWALPDVEECQRDRRLKKAMTCGSHTSSSPSHLGMGNLVRSHKETVAAARDIVKYEAGPLF
jgi:hypothetical protein